MNEIASIAIDSIRCGDRFRKDFGDLSGLAASIEQLGLLQPIGVNSQCELIFGQRRLKAFQLLGRSEIPAHVIDIPTLVLGEHAENENRKDFTPSERVAIGLAVEAELGKRRGSNQYQTKGELGENFHEALQGRTAEIAAGKAGFGNENTYRQAKTVVENAAPELVEAMDSGAVAVSTAARLAGAPLEVQQQAALDPKRAVELAKAASAAKTKEIQAGAKEIRENKTKKSREERIDRIVEISKGNADLNTDVRYPVLYADPPWRYEHVESESRAIENQYPTMTLDDICALRVHDLATPDAILFLWATSPKLAESMRVIEAWGFTYRTCAVWDKQKIGMGYYFRQQHELLLIATRGEIPPPSPEFRPPSVYAEPKSSHSKKPQWFAETIESMYSELPKIELFCRSPRKGWAVWGNQSC